MDAVDASQTPFAKRRIPGLCRPNASLSYIVYCRLFAAGSLVHLTLPDAMDPSWLVPNVGYALGAAMIAANGCLLGWLLCAAGTSIPLLLLGDQLTQSVYLLACAIAFIAAWPGRSADLPARIEATGALSVRMLTVSVYLVAAFHKLNRDFFDPSVSCATAGMDVLAENWGLPFLAAEGLSSLWPGLFVCAEVAMAAALIARPSAALVLGLLIHIPLTLVFAPAFAFVMIPGWVLCLHEEDLRHLGRTLRRRWVPIAATGAALAATSIGLYFRDHWVPYPWWFAKEVVLWIGLTWVVTAWVSRPGSAFRWWGGWRVGRPGFGAMALAALFWLNALTPYTGLQFHHTGAMLSNLRIDRGCWNHFLIPEGVRWADPYVRVVRVTVGGAVRGPDALEAHIADRLWSPTDLKAGRGRWCADGAGPLRLEGTYRSQPLRTDDLCQEWPLPDPGWIGYRRFQSNLSPECPQACIH